MRNFEVMSIDDLMGLDEKYSSGKDWTLEQDRPRATKRDEYEANDKTDKVKKDGLTSRKPL